MPRRPSVKKTNQLSARKLAQQKKRLDKAVRRFRPRKSERGTVVFVGVEGGRPKNRGNKGWAVYVTKNGKKKVLKSTKGLAPQKRENLSLKNNRTLRKRMMDFEGATVARNQKGKPIVKGRTKTKKGADIFSVDETTLPKDKERIFGQAVNKRHAGQYDFSEKVVRQLAKELKKTMEGQRSRRSFLIHAKVLVEGPFGDLMVFDFRVPIARQDHVAIELAGLEQFIRLKFYAFMAQELAFRGFVTAGSANHVRRLKENTGKERSEWTNKGEAWKGRDKDQVHIRTIQWQIQQS